MTDESAFLRAILADPRDVGIRLAYADWLEESGGPGPLRRAEYIRTECQMDGLAPADRRSPELEARLIALRAIVGNDWWRELDWGGVHYCVQFRYRCPQRWDTLLATKDSEVRHCTECRLDVHYCRTEKEAYGFAGAGKCVAIDSRRLRFPPMDKADDSDDVTTVGIVDQVRPERIPLPLRGQRPATE
jgi:uncharacterized protein (TIGR02996 family)